MPSYKLTVETIPLLIILASWQQILLFFLLCSMKSMQRKSVGSGDQKRRIRTAKAYDLLFLSLWVLNLCHHISSCSYEFSALQKNGLEDIQPGTIPHNAQQLAITRINSPNIWLIFIFVMVSFVHFITDLLLCIKGSHGESNLSFEVTF